MKILHNLKMRIQYGIKNTIYSDLKRVVVTTNQQSFWVKKKELLLTSSKLGTTSLTMLQMVSKSEDRVSILKIDLR